MELEIFGVKKVCIPHTSTKLKHMKFFYYTILISTMHFFYNGHLCLLNVNGITCTRLKHALHFIIVLISVQEDGTVEIRRSEL